MCGNVHFQLGCLVSDRNLEVLDIRETSFEIDMQKISKKLRVLRADQMIHFDRERFPNLQYVEIEGHNIILEKIESNRSLYSTDFYFSGEDINQQMVPKHKNILLYIEKCVIDDQSLQRLLGLNPTKIHMNNVSFSSESMAQKFFNSAFFSQ